MSKIKERYVIAVDLDRTLARYEKWNGVTHIGDPVPEMLARVKAAIAYGHEVRIFTARADKSRHDYVESVQAIRLWWLTHVHGVEPWITNEKQLDVDEIWDDIAVGVEENTGALRSASRVPLGRAQEKLPGLEDA